MLYESRNDYDWLGHGIYFWENNYHRALEWALDLEKRGIVRNPTVLGAILCLGKCFDLSDSEFISQLAPAYNFLMTTEKVVPKNDRYRHRLDCAVIEVLHSRRKDENLPVYDSVRSIFSEGKEVYPEASFWDKNHIQICIRNPNCIKGFFLPRDSDPNYTPV
jgi:hypothetical protein